MLVKNPNYLIYGLCLFWCGALLGVSFIATPAKFLVAELDLITAIKVGRETFQVYHFFELVMICLVSLSVFIFRAEKIVWAYFSLLGLVLVTQYFWVQPLLEVNSDKLFAGIESQSKSYMHLYNILCDCLKAVLLIGFLPAISFINFEKPSSR